MKAPIPGYGVWTPQWNFEVTPGGPNITFNGTVEEVLDQLQEVNPKLMASFNLKSTNNDLATVDPKDFNVKCQDPKLRAGRVYAWQEGISYLRRVPGKPVGGPGPGECGRVSCSWNTGIWWCNDDDKEKTLESFRDIADGAQAGYLECTDTRYHEVWANGRMTHKTDNWNVIVALVDIDKKEERC
ncbi:uncharacterized protein CTRU02_208290 [Colletotrichum truncatum]|uniref:Uncharacterized protein n=1 Tax=Colletotrichum truncatum TaxID=5467 RepID=A0ACC3YVX8_COLTU|nr:uncharacterized protein CTRU02_07531 [Colletotrichum truncatum]KAF6791191.1 hypothetical protein CTRU02_07531 [Colletotrichum truncatum]